MKLHPFTCQLDDADYVELARAKVLVRNLFGLAMMPSNSQVVSWLLRSIPWEELEHGNGVEQREDVRNGPASGIPPAGGGQVI